MYLGWVTLASLSGVILASAGFNNLSAVAMFVAIYGGIIVAIGYFQSVMLNLNMSHTTLQDVQLRCKLDPIHFIGLYLVNGFLMLITLGLATPWAKIRVLKYKLDNAYLKIPEGKDLSNFVPADSEKIGVFADATVDFWDIDIGF